MKVKITFTYFKDVEPEAPSATFDHYQFIGRIIKEIEGIDKEPWWNIEKEEYPWVERDFWKDKEAEDGTTD